MADESEKIILKDSPLKDYILAMKEDMKNVRSFINMMDSGAATYSKLEPQAKAQYDALEKAQATHSQLNMDNAKKANKEHSYNNFYSQMHDFLLDTRKIMRDAGERGTLTENDLEGLDRYHD